MRTDDFRPSDNVEDDRQKCDPRPYRAAEAASAFGRYSKFAYSFQPTVTLASGQTVRSRSTTSLIRAMWINNGNQPSA